MQGETTEGTVVSVFKSYNGDRVQVQKIVRKINNWLKKESGVRRACKCTKPKTIIRQKHWSCISEGKWTERKVHVTDCQADRNTAVHTFGIFLCSAFYGKGN